MSKGLLQRLALASALFATGALLFALAGGGPQRYSNVVAATPMAIANDAPPTLLPTVVVRADAIIPTLPTVTVRAQRLDGERSNVVASASDHARATGTGGASSCSSSMARCAGLEMPYYSFGKTLRSFRE